MNNNKIEMTIVTSNRAGVLSSIMMMGVKLGLMIRRNQSEKIDEDTSRVYVVFDGHLNCSKDELINEMLQHSEIYSIEDITTDIQNKKSRKIELNNQAASTIAKITNLQPHELITKESLEVAEKELIQILGPVAPMLVKSVTQKTKHIGDLFLLLSEQLEDEDKKDFLSLVNGLKIDSL